MSSEEHPLRLSTATIPVARTLLLMVFGGSLVAKLAAATHLLKAGRGTVLVDAAPSQALLATTLELVVVILLLARRRPLYGFAGSAVLAMLFYGYVLYLHLGRAIVLACGCYGNVKIPFAAHLGLLLGMFIVSWSGILGCMRAAQPVST